MATVPTHKRWYHDKQTLALITGFISTVLTSINLLLGII